ncbi:MAG: glutaredoxin family protein [Piscirickettsiaceae bacterium]|nr:glutaredoxin family protein [Piscirickettsiaceae bacterium]
MAQIIIYTTAACHLCDIAKKLLVKANQHIPFDIINTEISNNKILVSLYGKKIPVIEFENGKKLDWPFRMGDIISNLS